MNAQTAVEKQIARYREMTGEQRLATALDLHELARDVARAGIGAQFPGTSKDEVDLRLKQRIALAYRVQVTG